MTLILINSCSDLDRTKGTISIKPVGLDLNGVAGFAIVDNSPNTKAEGDDIVTTAPQSIYSIDENGNVTLSIFYFEVTTSEDQDGNTVETQIQKEISNALQVVPTIITDLGKYILFSGCKYQMNDLFLSDESRKICEEFINWNRKDHMVYMIRKSDGALFDLSDQSIFTYYALFNDDFYNSFSQAENEFHSRAYIPKYTYTTSAKGNLFVRGSDPTAIFSIVDNGNAINVKKMTQDYHSNELWYIRRFAIDMDENIYVYNRAHGEPATDGLHIYYANGGFDAYMPKPDMSLYEGDTNYRCSDMELIDILYDESGVPYIFFINEIWSINLGYQQWVMSARLNNGSVEYLNEAFFRGDRQFYEHNGSERHYYLGYYDNSFNWCMRFDTQTPLRVLSYNTETNTWTLNAMSEEIIQIALADYDAIIYGGKTYAAKVSGNVIEVTEIDFVTETYRTYSLNVDISSIKSPTYKALMVQDVPYLNINGRYSANGSYASISVNLINGENNSTFASDTRNVVSFYRIN